MKRGKILLTILIGLFLLNFASAYYSYSLSDMLNEFDASTVFLVAIFIVLFALINYSTSKMFKDNKATGGIVSFCISFLAVYGINRSGFNFENIFYNLGYSLGIPEDLLYTIIVILVVAGLAYLFFVWERRRQAPYIVGILMIISSFFMYESEMLIILGIIVMIVGWFIYRNTPEQTPPTGARS